MAKGNMLLGYSRGSVGSMVFSRVKGQQITKARNSSPANPKTKKQMQQRSSFISPVKFYTHGVQALFKFAFSDKKVTESDFNAFMRNNAKAAFPVTKAENENPGFPALGNYMMTKGKLPEVPFTPGNNTIFCPYLTFDNDDSVVTVGELSQKFVNLGWAEVGDIITFVTITEHVEYTDQETLDLLKGEFPTWALSQFVVDINDDTDMADVLQNVVIGGYDGKAILYPIHAEDLNDMWLCSFAVIRSRETALGLEVSTSYLHNGGYIDDYIQFRNSKAQVDKVLADWGATGDAILQGSIAKK